MPSPKFDVDIRGQKEVLAELDKYWARVKKALAAALYVEGQQIITAAKELTPVDEGTLRSSGFGGLPKETGNGGYRVEIGFGGPAGSGNHEGDTNSEDVGYAVYVHEDLNAHHVVGQAKYLEVPINRAASGMARRIASRIRRRI